MYNISWQITKQAQCGNDSLEDISFVALTSVYVINYLIWLQLSNAATP